MVAGVFCGLCAVGSLAFAVVSPLSAAVGVFTTRAGPQETHRMATWPGNSPRISGWHVGSSQ